MLVTFKRTLGSSAHRFSIKRHKSISFHPKHFYFEKQLHRAMIPFISSHLIKMAGISSKFFHCAPPLLRAFDLSNQLSFSLHQNCKAAIFSDRYHPFILTKSPSFPPHPQNLPLGLFPSMVSSVDRISPDEWRHHDPSLPKVITRLSNSIDPSSIVSASAISLLRPETSHNSAATATVAAGIPLIGRPEQMWTELEAEAGVCITPPTEAVEKLSGRSDASDESELSAKEITENSPVAALLSSSKPSPTPSPTSDTDRETLRVMLEMEDFILKLDEERRWEIAVLAERQLVSRFPFRGHSKVITRISNSIDPSSAVSASAISSLRPETSHNSAATAPVSAGIPLTGHLEQMWTELEAEAGVCLTPPTSVVEKLSGRSDACDESELSAKEITENSPAAALLSSPKPSPTPSPTSDTSREILRVMLEMEDFILKLEEERRWEIAMLA